MKPETKFQNKVLKDLKKIPNLWVLKTQEKTRRGVPDLIICANGKFIAAEIKSNNKAIISPIQHFELKCIENSGGLSLILTPENWENTFSIMENYANTKNV